MKDTPNFDFSRGDKAAESTLVDAAAAIHQSHCPLVADTRLAALSAPSEALGACLLH